MTITEAQQSIGRAVIYRTCDGRVEQGIITSANDLWVFVRYGANPGSQATRAEDLKFLSVTP